MARFKGKTHVVAILDRSGSMASLAADTLGGYNQWLKKTQKASKGADVALTLHLFDTQHDFVQENAPIQEVKPLTDQVYYARGGTALLDAIGQTVNRVRAQMKKGDRALCLICTDGMENSSHEYNGTAIAALIKACERSKHWTFDYLGANQDAFAVGTKLGFKGGVTTQASREGTQALWTSNVLRTADYVGSATGQMAGRSQAEYDESLATLETDADGKPKPKK